MCYSSSEPRAKLLLQWLTDDLGLKIDAIDIACSDASFRRYFRVTHADGCHVVMDAPPDKETTLPFIRVARLFDAALVHVPGIFQQNVEQGFLLLEDFGSRSFLDGLQTDTVDGYYQDALNTLFKIQSNVDIGNCQLPVYDQAMLARELAIFYEWFLETLLGVVLPVPIRQHLDQLLIDSALLQPQVCVHRDFHSRNLMLLDDDSPGVIDFQDAVIGPISYDLVSLLRDCYIRWPELRIQQWLESYYQRLLEAEMVAVDLVQFKRWFDLMGLQRHLKAVGIFSRLHLRDNKSGYLAEIPRTMGYIDDICQLYPELEAFSCFLKQQVLPIYQARL